MPFEQKAGLKYFSFNLLDKPDVCHAIFTRRGGVSPKPWNSLNFGGTVGDDLKRVAQNQTLAFNAIGRNPGSVYDVWQVHSSIVVCAESPRKPTTPHVQADGIITNRVDVTLLMRFADCVPILLYDPIGKVVGLVHSGWKGTVGRIAQNAVEVMVKRYGSNSRDILAGIGPSISVGEYAIGDDVCRLVQQTFGASADEVLFFNHGEVKFDLWKANKILLESVGVKEIEIADVCTASQLDDWFSHRGEDGATGRFGVMIGLVS